MSNFDWDAGKAEANLRKQGVSFLEADTVVLDPDAMFFPDRAHSRAEVRMLILGYSTRDRLLMVVTSEGDRRPRIISAWRATKRERRVYEQR